MYSHKSSDMFLFKNWRLLPLWLSMNLVTKFQGTDYSRKDNVCLPNLKTRSEKVLKPFLVLSLSRVFLEVDPLTPVNSR